LILLGILDRKPSNLVPRYRLAVIAIQQAIREPAFI